MNPAAWNWRIVLVRPRNPLNIGAAARAMANFGFHDLVVVKPYEPTWQETRSAVGAEDLVQSARAVPTLLDAIGDVALVVGTTAGSRRHLTRDLVSLTHLTEWLALRRMSKSAAEASRETSGSSSQSQDSVIPAKAGIHQEKRSTYASQRLDSRLRGNDEVGGGSRSLRAALLFGSEKTGLSNDEMSSCQAPVAVSCYELARQGLFSNRAAGGRIHRSDPATQQSLAHLFDRAARVLDTVGYLKPKSRAATLLKLREFLLELGLTNYDARILGGVLAQIEWKLGGLSN